MYQAPAWVRKETGLSEDPEAGVGEREGGLEPGMLYRSSQKDGSCCQVWNPRDAERGCVTYSRSHSTRMLEEAGFENNSIPRLPLWCVLISKRGCQCGWLEGGVGGS